MTSFRRAFSTLAFPAASLGEALTLGRSWGYDGVELRLIDGELIDPGMPAAQRAQIRRTLAAAGLPAVAVDSSIRLTDGAAATAQLNQFLELASDWEAPLVRVFGGPLPAGGPGRAAGLAAAARVLTAAAPRAARLGVRIGLETHDDFSAARVVAGVLARVPDPGVGAVWDSHHPFRAGESAAEAYAALAPRILLAQVKDARRAPERADGWQLVLLGQGEVPVREMLALLAGGGYQGWVSVEWEKRWHPEIEEPQVALPQHLAVLRAWQDGGNPEARQEAL
ncbi:MAG TPA: TIM barrel protein [Streptosporangiaceae bacterium]|jgi:sugar phosphate isomerase/epimerase